jgi:hypothetical protein
MTSIKLDDEQTIHSVKDALTELQAAGKRLSDPALMAAIRRVSGQLVRDAQRCATAEAKVVQLAAQVEVLMRQRDEALAANRGMPERLELLGAEFKRAVQQRKDAVAQRDQARLALERLRAEGVAQKTSAPNISQREAIPAAPKAPKPKQPAIFDTIPPIEPSPEEIALMSQRASVVAEVDQLNAIGKRRNAAQAARLAVLQAQLAEFAPKVKAFKAARHAKLMALQSEVLANEALKAAGLA